MTRQARLIFALIIFAAIILCYPVSAPAQADNQKVSLTGTISGRVTVGGKAAVNISIAAYTLEAMNARKQPTKTVTDVEGRYRLTGLPPAQYQVLPLTPELTAAKEEQEPNFGFMFAPSSKSVTLAAGENVENIDLKLVRGAVITGRVTDANDKPVVEEFITLLPVDEKGTPLNSPRMPFRTESYQTDDRGVYRIYGLPPGRYKLSAGMDAGGGINYARVSYPRTFYPDTPDQNKARVVELAEGGEATGIDIQVGAQEEIYRASGRVVDAETGQPIAGVRLSYLVNPKTAGRDSPMYIENPTSARGSFQISRLTPGSYGAYVTSEYEGGDYYSDIVYFEIVDKDVAGLEVKAIRGLTLSGVVVAERETQTNAPVKIEKMRIFAWAMQATDSQERNAGASAVGPDGSFRLSGLRPGRFSFYLYPMGSTSGRPTISRIERDGIAVPVQGGVELQAGQSASDLRIFITYGKGTIRGAVTFVGGVLPPDYRLIIRCTRENKQDCGGSYVDVRGRFFLTGLSPGTYEITLQTFRTTNGPASAIAPQKQFVQVSNESEAEANFVVDLTPKVRP